MNFSGYKALTFDVYGTLIDWEPHIAAFLQDWGARNGVSASDEELISAYDDARAHYQTLKPAWAYPEVLKSSFSYICDRWRVPVIPSEQEAFAASVKDWEPYPDVVEALAYLKQHFLLGAMSNIDDASLKLSIAKMQVEFDIVVTAERVGAYKPAMPHFIHAANDLGKAGVSVNEQLHVAQSLRADIRPANDLLLAHVWINRDGRLLGRKGYGAELAVPQNEFASVGDLAEAHKMQMAA